MSWFKKSSSVKAVSPPSEQRHKRSRNANLNTENNKENLPKTPSHSSSLCQMPTHLIEIVDPEDFFEDPEHVRNYKEEEKFLSIMSEWEIIENPAHMNGNYFSADFEDELLQLRTSNNSVDRLANASNNNETEAELQNLVLQILPSQKKRSKRHLCVMMFRDNIENGLKLPVVMSQPTTTSNNSTESDSTSAYGCKKRRLNDAEEENKSSHNICPNMGLKDCSINRRKLKTEALANSIMGAIGKCPNKDSSFDDLLAQQSNDACHPYGERSSCDHYDIKQFFRLDDNGNILLNISHIEEVKGYGFAVAANNKRLYKRYARECECVYEHFESKAQSSCRKCLCRAMRIVCRCFIGKRQRAVSFVKTTLFNFNAI